MSDQPAAPGVNEQKPIGGSDEVAQTKEQKEETQSALEYEAESGAGEVNGVPTMTVKVFSPTNDYFEGPAFSISAENDTGPFDVLPKHHNFITLLNPCDVIVRTVNKDDRRISISGGLMHVKADRVAVFLDV